MDADLLSAIEALHAGPARAVIDTTGAGGQSFGWLLCVSGASNTLLEASIPYAYSALDECLNTVGGKSGGACNAETAKSLAQAALLRAEALTEAEKGRGQDTSAWELAGVGCTAAIVSNVPKKGDHRAHVSFARKDTGVTTYSLTLAKGQRDRPGEDSIVSRLIIAALLEGAGMGRERAMSVLTGALLDSEKVQFS